MGAAKRRWFRRFAFVIIGVIALLVVTDAIDGITGKRKLDAFQQRVGGIHDGMTEAEVRAIAGPPDSASTDGFAVLIDDRKRTCAEASGISVMAYSVDWGGWISEKLDIPSGSWTLVVCLNDNGRVVKTYYEIIHI